MAFANLYQSGLSKALPGLVYGQPRLVTSGRNEATLYSATSTIDTVLNATLYTATFNGVTVSYTSDGDATDVEIRDGLVSAVASNIYLKSDFKATPDASNTWNIVARYSALAVSGSVDANQTLVVNQASGQDLKPGTLARVTSISDGLQNLGPAASGQPIHGAIVHSQSQFVDEPRRHWIDEPDGAADKTGLSVGQMGGLLRQGSVWLIAETTFAPGDSLFYRVAASGAGSVLGAVRRTDDGANTDQLTSGFAILDYDSASNLVLVSLNLP